MDVRGTGDASRESTPQIEPFGKEKNGLPENGCASEANACPLLLTEGTEILSPGLQAYASFKDEVKHQCQHFGIEDIDKVEEKFSDRVQKSFKNFFDSLASFGSDKKSKHSPDVITGVNNALAMLSPTAGMSVARMLAFSFESMCARLAATFDSTVDEVARTMFSGFCIASAGIRSALPMLAEMARQANDPTEIFIVSVASAVMASVYLATSAISTLLAAHHAILNSPTTAKMAEKVRGECERIAAKKSNFEEVARKSLMTIGQMLMEWKANVSANFLSLAKEFFLFSGAAVSLISALGKIFPVLAIPYTSIISGFISLFSNALETGQGVVDYVRLKGQLESLRQLSNAGENKPELSIEIENLERQLAVSKSRIFKGLLNMVLSAGSIVVGMLSIFFSTSMPVLPILAAVIATISLASVVILGIVSLLARKMNMAGNAEGVSTSVVTEEDSGSEATAITASEDDGDIGDDHEDHSTQATGIFTPAFQIAISPNPQIQRSGEIRFDD